MARPGAGPGSPLGSATAGAAFDDNFEANLPIYLETLEAHGRRRADQLVLVGFQGEWLSDECDRRYGMGREPAAAREPVAAAGADGAIVLARTTADVDALVEAVDRW